MNTGHVSASSLRHSISRVRFWRRISRILAIPALALIMFSIFRDVHPFFMQHEDLRIFYHEHDWFRFLWSVSPNFLKTTIGAPERYYFSILTLFFIFPPFLGYLIVLKEKQISRLVDHSGIQI
jgi:hypothetical protein